MGHPAVIAHFRLQIVDFRFEPLWNIGQGI